MAQSRPLVKSCYNYLRYFSIEVFCLIDWREESFASGQSVRRLMRNSVMKLFKFELLEWQRIRKDRHKRYQAWKLITYEIWRIKGNNVCSTLILKNGVNCPY